LNIAKAQCDNVNSEFEVEICLNSEEFKKPPAKLKIIKLTRNNRPSFQ